MIERLKTGCQLLMTSFGVIGRNRSLLLFPATTAILTILIAAVFVMPIALQPTGHAYSSGEHWSAVGNRLFIEIPPEPGSRHAEPTYVPKPLAIACGALFYFLSMFLATFFNVAFTHAVFNALRGAPVSLSEAFAFALTKLKPILLWTVFAGAVGMLIRWLEEKLGFFGRWIVGLIGAAWSIAAVFVIPVLVLEEHPDNPLDVLRKSASTIVKTWGEALAGYAGLQIGGTIAALAGMGILVPSFVVGIAFDHYGLMMVGILVFFVFIMAFSYLSAVASQIYLCVLYLYASTGVVPDGYTTETLALAWKPKKA